MKEIRMAWVLLPLLVAMSGAATCMGRQDSLDGHAAETQRKGVLLWFGDQGTVTLDGKSIDPARWKDSWRAALAQATQRPVRVGADDGVPYARVHEAYTEAWQSRARDAGYAIDRQGRSVPLSELTHADIATPPGPHILAIAVDGRVAWDGVAVGEPGLDQWMKQQVMPKLPQDRFVALIELKIDPLTPYGTVKRFLTIFAAGGSYRVASFEESDIVARKLMPLPPVLHIPPPGSNCGRLPPGVSCQ